MGEENGKKRNGISNALKRFYGVGDFGFSFMTNIETYYFQYFLTNIAAFSIPVVTMISTIMSVFDAALSWMYGAILNSMKPQKWGRYRSWLVMAPWLVPFLYAFQFIKVSDGALGIIVIIVAAISSHIVWNLPFVANMSMISVASKTPEDRMALSSSRALWQSLGRVCYSYVGPGVVALAASIFGEKFSYGVAAFAFGAVMAAGYFAHFKMFEGYEETGAEEIARMEKEKAARAETGKKEKGGLIKALSTNPYLLGLMVADLTKYIYSFVSSGIAVYYFTYVAKQPGLTATFILISNLMGVIGSYLSKAVAAKVSPRNAVIYSYLIMVVALGAGFALHNSAWAMIILVSIAQFFCSITTACGPALYADCAIYSEYKTGTNATGLIMGLGTVPIKIGVVFRGLLINACLAIAGFSLAAVESGEVTARLSSGISLGFTLIPAAAVLIGALIMIFGFRLTRDKIAEYSAEIAARKQA